MQFQGPAIEMSPRFDKKTVTDGPQAYPEPAGIEMTSTLTTAQ
jgi:hypothetical protein